MGHINTDIPELKGYDTGIVLGNLERLSRRLDASLDATVAHLYELAEAIHRDAAGDLETLETILRALAVDEPSSMAAVKGDDPCVAALTTHMDLRERLILYRAIAEGRGHRVTPPRKGGAPQTEVSTTAMAKGRIAYMPNPFADQAYLRLSRAVADDRGTPCRAAHCLSFAEACEEVVRGQCEYCILPVENTADGKLVGFSRMLVEHGLFVTAVCDVENHALSDKNVTRFALLQQAVTGNFAFAGISDPKAYVEVLHTPAASVSVTDLMVAAAFCGLELYRVDTLPMADGSRPVCAVWYTRDATETDLRVFLGYLALEASDDILLGLYNGI